MDTNKFYKILEFNKENFKEIRKAAREFYEIIEVQAETVIPDIQSLAGIILSNREIEFWRVPLKSEEIGALWIKLNGQEYIILNTSRSLAYNNFALAHELYHSFIQERVLGDEADIYLNNYEDDIEEMKANAFAGSILMPKVDFVRMVRLLNMAKGIKSNKKYEDELVLVIMLMNYYKTTYMSVVIRCFELGIFDCLDTDLVKALLKYNNERRQKEICDKVAEKKGEMSIMNATKINDFQLIISEAEAKGKEQILRGIITEDDLKYRLGGMKKVYNSIMEAGE